MKIDEKFYTDYDRLIRKLIRDRVREDEVDEYVGLVYERLLAHPSYDEERGPFNTWLGWVVKSVISNEQKRLDRSQDVLDHAEPLEAAASMIGAEDAGTAKDELERVFAAARLSERDERIVRSFHIQGYTADEVAKHMGMEAKAVRQVLFRAMQALREAAE